MEKEYLIWMADYRTNLRQIMFCAIWQGLGYNSFKFSFSETWSFHLFNPKLWIKQVKPNRSINQQSNAKRTK